MVEVDHGPYFTVYLSPMAKGKKSTKSGLKPRKATVERNTKETKISLSLNIDGSGNAKIKTGLPFLDHMLTLVAGHGLFDLEVRAKGDLDVDYHHTVEDIGICLGKAFREALGGKEKIERYAYLKLPMDEARAAIALDISGRAHLDYKVKVPTGAAGGIPEEIFHEFFDGFVKNALVTLHIELEKAHNSHHAVEAVFKAFGVALRRGATINPRKVGVPSTKGTL